MRAVIQRLPACPLACISAALAACLFSFAQPAVALTDEFDDSTVAHAFGTVVDSITVSGNTRTRDHALLREMETRVGDVLDRKTLRRDVRFLTGLTPIATVAVRADSLAPGHSALRLEVTERSSLFINSILPFFKFNFETGLSYGVRLKAKNFRGRLESLSLSYTRNARRDDDVSLSWSAPWLGWKHIAVGGRVSYFNRGEAEDEVRLLELSGVSGFVALPLTESRIRFSQFQASLAFDKTRQGRKDEPSTNEVTLSPQIGYRFDSRDSRIRPERGEVFFVAVGANYAVEGDRATFYRLHGEVRAFRLVSPRTVLAAWSNVFYQFGDFPDFATVKLGGARSLRGYPEARFSGFHRWFQTVEWRYQYLPKKVFRLPIVKEVDVGLAFVVFVDSGITWNDASDFDLNRFHGTGGVGLRFYSPLRDVVQFDFGASAEGDARFHFGTGVRF